MIAAGGTAAVSALYLVQLGLPLWAAAVALAALVTTVLGLLWWRRRGTRAGRALAVALVPVSLLTWALTDNITGLAVVAVAVCAIVVEFGTRPGLIVSGLMLAALIAVYLASGQPIADVVANAVVTASLILLGLLAAQIVATLDRARRLAESAARAKQDEALAELDRALSVERMEQARALHDDLGQQLTLIGMGLELAQRMRRTDPDAAWDEVATVRSAAGEALHDLRVLVRALSPLTPQETAEIDLNAALEQLAAAFTGTGLRVTLERGRDDAAQGSVDSLAYRIIQESLTNVVRHAHAQHVTIQVSTGDEIHVRVVDDGERTAPHEPGFGLRQLRARVEAVGGTFRAASRDVGFEVNARYPAPEAR